jgi:hypothetical protein
MWQQSVCMLLAESCQGEGGGVVVEGRQVLGA